MQYTITLHFCCLSFMCSVGKIGYYEPDAYYIKDYSLCQETTCQISQQMVPIVTVHSAHSNFRKSIKNSLREWNLLTPGSLFYVLCSECKVLCEQ